MSFESQQKHQSSNPTTTAATEATKRVKNTSFASLTSSSNDTDLSNNNNDKLRVVFIHLDWGIGGAEQLMLQLCHATKSMEVAEETNDNDDDDDKQKLKESMTATNDQRRRKMNIDLHLVTSYCNPNHCFEYLHPTKGIYYKYLNVWGSFIPSHIPLVGNKGKALMSTIRLLYLAYCIIHHSQMYCADIIVLDVLSTPLYLLRYFCHAQKTNFLFYCHFPDQLLIQKQQQQGEGDEGDSSNKSSTSIRTRIKHGVQKWYRTILNYIEEHSMILADTIVVNSKYTQQVVYDTFPIIRSSRNIQCPILYPALEIIDPPISNNNHTDYQKRSNLIVSLNRYERKKNLSLLIEAIAYIRNHHNSSIQKEDTTVTTTTAKIDIDDIHVIIAGGYDRKNRENIEYHIELQELVQTLQIPNITFQFSISDSERTRLLHIATMVIYTPSHEHFGIVPLEAMYAGTPVIACNTGGPIETIIHGTTGYLCDATAESFGTAIYELLLDPIKANRMGQNGHDHVVQNFSPNQLQRKWVQLLYQTIQNGNVRRRKGSENYALYYSITKHIVSPRTILLLLEATIVFVFIYVVLYQYGMQQILLLLFSSSFSNHNQERDNNEL